MATIVTEAPPTHISAYDFALPPELIAQHPADPRDSARLLVVGRKARHDHRISDLPELLRPGDLLVFNDTRVLPVRLAAKRGEARIELTLHQPLATTGDPYGGELPGSWRAFARPARRCRPGDRLHIARDFTAEVLARGDGGEVTLAFDRSGDALRERLERHGHMPLPPYIRRSHSGDPRDRSDYQTIFARRPGAVAAPTASLHFTQALMNRIAARGIGHAFITLHVGAGTFLPIRSEDLRAHLLHAEWFSVDAATAAAIERTRASGGRIVAVGTTVLRTLESVANQAGRVMSAQGETRLFIRPGHRFRVVDLLLTNFHLPRSTLFVLVCAFAGMARMWAAYRHAIARRYRFYSYGDACLLERAPER